MWWKIISLWDFHVVPGNLSGVRQAFSLMLDCHLIIIFPNILSGISIYPSDKPSPWCWILISWSVDSQIFTQYFIWNIRQPFSLMLNYHLIIVREALILWFLPNILSGISFYPSDNPSPWCWIIISWSVDSLIFTQYFIWNIFLPIRQPFSLTLINQIIKDHESNHRRSHQIKSVCHIISSNSPMEFNVLTSILSLKSNY